jgi:endonuclease-3
MVTPALFRDFPSPEHLAHSNFDEIFPYIKSVTYPNSKTKHLLGMAKMLYEDFDSKVPETVEELGNLQSAGIGSRYACISCVKKNWIGKFKF